MVEGCPPSDSVTPVTVDIFIEPTGTVNILSAQDQVSQYPYVQLTTPPGVTKSGH